MNRRPSSKVTASSAIAGTVTALLYAVQQAEAMPDLPTWVIFLLAIAASTLATFAAGYQTPETNPAPSAIRTVRIRGGF